VRLVLGILIVAERPALRVEDDCARLRLVVGSEASQHVEHPVDRAGRLAFGLFSSGSAWNARYRYDEPSTSNNVLSGFVPDTMKLCGIIAEFREVLLNL